MQSKTRTAVFDIGGHHGLSVLIDGPIRKLEDLNAIEEALRAIVLHDEAIFLPVPVAASDVPIKGQGTLDPAARDRRTPIRTPMTCVEVSSTSVTFELKENLPPGEWSCTAISLDEMYGLFTPRSRLDVAPDVQLTDALQELVENWSNAKLGSPNYEVHLNFLKTIFWVVQNGGSAVCKLSFARAAIDTASSFPDRLFRDLDRDWKEFGERIQNAELGPAIPPVMAIVLSRSASRDKIPTIVRDLRDEWATARSKVWSLMDQLKTARTVSQARDNLRELAEASKYFSKFRQESSTHPLQILWELFVGGVGGAFIGSLAGHSPEISAATGVVGQAIRTVQKDANVGSILFGRGAFDLARRVRREVDRIDFEGIRSILNDSERKVLGM
jgi:hypothetical protein